MSRLICDGSLICWNCSVFSFNQKHKCWKCDFSPAYTRNHLVKDPVLDTHMKEYLATGTLQLGYMEVLENSWKNLEATEEMKEEVGNSCGFSVGDSCLASWSQDGVWYRAIVQGVTQGGLEVLFTDYGNTDIVDWGNVRALYCALYTCFI